MVTLNKVGDNHNIMYLELYGLSTDDKPTKTFDGVVIKNGSTYYEMDTGNTSIYDEENHKWYPI